MDKLFSNLTKRNLGRSIAIAALLLGSSNVGYALNFPWFGGSTESQSTSTTLTAMDPETDQEETGREKIEAKKVDDKNKEVSEESKPAEIIDSMVDLWGNTLDRFHDLGEKASSLTWRGSKAVVKGTCSAIYQVSRWSLGVARRHIPIVRHLAEGGKNLAWVANTAFGIMVFCGGLWVGYNNWRPLLLGLRPVAAPTLKFAAWIVSGTAQAICQVLSWGVNLCDPLPTAMKATAVRSISKMAAASGITNIVNGTVNVIKHNPSIFLPINKIVTM